MTPSRIFQARIKQFVGLLPLLAISSLLTACSDLSTMLEEEQKVLTPLEKALTTGDASHVEEAEVFLSAALDTIQQQDKAYHQDIKQLLNLQQDGGIRDDGSSLTDISWDATHDAAQLNAQFGFNAPLLFTNASHNNDDELVRQIAVLGEDQPVQNRGRYLVIGSNPMRSLKRGFDINDQMQSLMKNSIQWLSQRNDFANKPLKVVISHLDQSHYFPDEVATREWLDAQFPEQVSYNLENECDAELLASCITEETDVLIISQHGLADSAQIPAIVQQLDSALKANIGVLYMHWDGGLTELGGALLDRLNVTYVRDNYWQKAIVKNANPLLRVFELEANIAGIKRLLTTLDNKNVSFDWSQCEGENCSAVDGYQEQFLAGATSVHSLLRNLDHLNINVFDQQNSSLDKYRLEKTLILLSDALRQKISYPMDKITTPDIEFLSALYTDYTSYISRTINPVQSDLGNFSRTDFSAAKRIEKNVTLASKRNFRAAGVYAIPGETVKVTRLDNAELTTKIFISSVRNGATHIYAENGYTRPRYLQSAHLEIKPGESIEFTSAVGGPIQVYFSANDFNTQFKFENVGQHPYWSSSLDDESFEQQMAEGLFD
jgi:hypothetical protein